MCGLRQALFEREGARRSPESERLRLVSFQQSASERRDWCSCPSRPACHQTLLQLEETTELGLETPLRSRLRMLNAIE